MKITYECNYTDNGVKYKGVYESSIYFYDVIKEVSVTMIDKEVDGNNKFVKDGFKKELKLNHKLRYQTNQLLVRDDFSDFPTSN